MSLDVNTRLIEEAQELIPELAGTKLDEAMEANIKSGDMEALFENLKQAHNLLFDEHFNPNEVY